MGRKKKSEEEKEEKSYHRNDEAEGIVKQLFEKYPEILWALGDPSSVCVMGVDNKERPKSSTTLASIRPISGVFKAILDSNKIPLKYVIEMYFSDWQELNTASKNFLIFHELLHIFSPEKTKLRRHNIEDFGLLVSVLGINNDYTRRDLPDLLSKEGVKFDPQLVAQFHEEFMDKKEDDPEEASTPPEE